MREVVTYLPPQIISQQTFYSRLIEDIQTAQQSVDIHVWIARKDKTTAPIFDAMEHAARRGVRVRFVADSVSSRFFPPTRSVSSAANAIGRINRRLPSDQQIHYHHSRQKGDSLNPLRRNHKKLAIIDANTPLSHGYIGGSNIAGKYFPWRDSMTHVEGDLANLLAQDFDRTWNKTNQGFVTYQRDKPGETTELLADSKHTEGINTRIAQEIDQASHTIWIETSYLRGATIRDALIQAKRRNPDIDIKLLVPHPALSNDYPYRFFPKVWLNPLEKAGIPVYLYGKKERQFSHAKTFLTDDTIVVGSSNFVDGTVVGGNAELILISQNQDLYQQAKTWIEEGLKHAKRYRRGGFMRVRTKS